MGIFETTDLAIDSLKIWADAIPDEELKTNFINVIQSINSKLNRLQNSLENLKGLIPTGVTIDTDLNYSKINNYLNSFVSEALQDFESITSGDPNAQGNLDTVYQQFLLFDSAIDGINNNNNNLVEVARIIVLIGKGELYIPPPPADYSNLFTFENEMTLNDFLKNFDDGIANFNEKVTEYNDNKKEFNTLYEKVDENIHKRQAEETIRRANVLISEKIEYYDSWIKLMYYLHRILLVILCIIIIISLVYKLL